MRASAVEYRAALKEKILVVAWKLFHSHGFKAVKMDDIAHELGISKRTLYEIYSTKEDVLYESFIANATNNLQLLRGQVNENNDVMDILTKFFSMHLKTMRDANPIFVDELKTIPRIKALIEETMETRRKKTIEFVKRGQNEGFFIEEINIDAYLKIHSILTENLYGTNAYKQFEQIDLFRSLIIIFIRSICTPMGIKRFDEILKDVKL